MLIGGQAMNTPTRDTLPPDVFRRLMRYFTAADVDWEAVLEYCERGKTGKLQINIKDGIARSATLQVDLRHER